MFKNPYPGKFIVFGGRYFLFKNKEKVTNKLNHFIRSGKNRVHLILDFDRTITQGKNKEGRDITVWQALISLLPPQAQLEYKRFHDKYGVLEVNNKLSVTDAVMWWESILRLFKENRIKLLDIKRAADGMRVRPYAKDLFKICVQKRIPVVIISAGIKNIIELFCKKEDIKPTILLSTELTFSSRGHVNGWKKETLIHVLNKKERGHQEIKKIKSPRPNTIVIGDNLNDASMVQGEKNVLRIAINPMGAEKEFLQKFDLIIKGESLLPIIKILNLFH